MVKTYKSSTKSMSKGLQVESSSNNFKLRMDEPESLGGTNEAMSPVEALLCALGGCQAIVVKAFAKAQGLDIEDFRVDLEGDIDLDGFLRKRDVLRGFQEIRYTMHFKTKESREKIEKFVEFIEDTCPVGDTINRKVAILNKKIEIE